MKTYFGLRVYEPEGIGKSVRLKDIERLPFFEFWRESDRGSTHAIDESSREEMVYLHDWERFSIEFIYHGVHRGLNENRN